MRSGSLALPAGVALAAELLDLSPPIEAEAVQRAFRTTALKVHPDHGGTERQFRALVQARDMLLDYAAGGQREAEPPRQAHESPRRTARVFGWRRSAKGNLWRKLGGVNVTVFATDDGFKWVGGDAGYSDDCWPSEAEACADAEEYWR